jgi:hypothetical protein
MRLRQGCPVPRSGSSHVATPRLMRPSPYPAVSVVCGSNAQRWAPVAGSSAMIRLNPVVRNNVPSTTIGVASKPLRRRLPLPSDTSPVWNVQATVSVETLSRLIWARDEKRVLPGSWPYTGQSPEGGSAAWPCDAAVTAHDSTSAVNARQLAMRSYYRTDGRTKVRPYVRHECSRRHAAVVGPNFSSALAAL